MKVALNTIVSFRYIMYDSGGKVLQDNSLSAPVRYLHGGSLIAANLQEQLQGLEAGEISEVTLEEKSGLYTFKVFVDAVRPAHDFEIKLGYPIDDGEICDDNCDCFINLK